MQRILSAGVRPDRSFLVEILAISKLFLLYFWRSVHIASKICSLHPYSWEELSISIMATLKSELNSKSFFTSAPLYMRAWALEITAHFIAFLMCFPLMISVSWTALHRQARTDVFSQFPALSRWYVPFKQVWRDSHCVYYKAYSIFLLAVDYVTNWRSCICIASATFRRTSYSRKIESLNNAL